MAVGGEQHYGRAAERLRVAKPALSRQIQDLEEEIGCQLFDRLPRGVKISAAGKSFLGDARRILQQLLPRYIEVQIYQAILETAASFFSAQMVAMRNATDNANDLVEDLSLTYNKVRQANITNQVTEIASAAEAMAASGKR